VLRLSFFLLIALCTSALAQDDSARFVGSVVCRNSIQADSIARDAGKWNAANDALMSILQTLAGSDSEF